MSRVFLLLGSSFFIPALCYAVPTIMNVKDVGIIFGSIIIGFIITGVMWYFSFKISSREIELEESQAYKGEHKILKGVSEDEC